MSAVLYLIFIFFGVPFLVVAIIMFLVEYIGNLRQKSYEKKVDKSKTEYTEERGVVTSKILRIKEDNFREYTVAVRTDIGNVYKFTGEHTYYKVREGESVTVVSYQEYSKSGRKLKRGEYISSLR